MSIVQPSTFNVAKVVISPPKPNKAGGKMAFVGYGESRNLIIQTPSLRIPFGVKNSTEGEYARPGPAKYSIDLNLRGHEENPKVKSFYEAVRAIDDYVFAQAEQNCKLWFGKQRSHDALAEAFTRSLKVGKSKDGKEYPPTVKVQLKKKLDTEEGSHTAENFDCPIYDQTSRSDPAAKPLEGIDIEELLARGSEVTTLLQASMIWIVNDRFGISWKAKQIRVDVSGTGGSSAGYGFVDDDDDVPVRGAAFQEPAEFSAPAPAPAPAPAAPAPAPAPAQPVFEDDDDDEIAAPSAPKRPTVTKAKIQTKLGVKK